jgi:hypothetical protein
MSTKRHRVGKGKRRSIQVGRVTFVPTNMLDASHVIYAKGTPGPIGWLPHSRKPDEASARLALEGRFFT